MIRREAGDGGGKSLFQLHRTISPQRHRATEKTKCEQKDLCRNSFAGI